jgi:hypothetical protein
MEEPSTMATRNTVHKKVSLMGAVYEFATKEEELMKQCQYDANCHASTMPIAMPVRCQLPCQYDAKRQCQYNVKRSCQYDVQVCHDVQDGFKDVQDGFKNVQDGFENVQDGFKNVQDGFRKGFNEFQRVSKGIQEGFQEGFDSVQVSHDVKVSASFQEFHRASKGFKVFEEPGSYDGAQLLSTDPGFQDSFQDSVHDSFQDSSKAGFQDGFNDKVYYYVTLDSFRDRQKSPRSFLGGGGGIIGSDIVDRGGLVVFTPQPNKQVARSFPEVQHVGTSRRHSAHSG